MASAIASSSNSKSLGSTKQNTLYSDEPVFNDGDRRRYVEGLASVVKPGGRLFLLCFSDDEPGTQGPRRVSRKEIEVAFAEEWKVESIEPTRFEVRPDLKDISFSEGGPRAWFVVVRRVTK